MRTILLSLFLILVYSSLTLAQSAVDVPTLGSVQSGASVPPSGWKCERNGEMEAVFDGTTRFPILYGGSRADTAAICEDDGNNGWVVAPFNWGLFTLGQHTVEFFDDGEPFAQSSFSVLSTGQEFLSADDFCLVQDFPGPGDRATFQWTDASQSPRLVTINQPVPFDPLLGTWALSYFDLGLPAERTLSFHTLTVINGTETLIGTDALGEHYEVTRLSETDLVDFPFDLLALRITAGECRGFVFDQSSTNRLNGLSISLSNTCRFTNLSRIDAMFAERDE